MSGSQATAAEYALMSSDPERAAMVRRRRMADELIRNSQSPEIIRSDTQGIARLLQAATGAAGQFFTDRADRQLQQGRQEDAANFFAKAMGGVAPAAQPAVAAPQPQAPVAGPAPNYGPNAGLLAQRDAMLSAPPQALAAASEARLPPGQPAFNPARPGANSEMPGWDAGTAAPTGRVNPNIGGNPSAGMPGPTVTAQAPQPAVSNNARQLSAMLLGLQQPNPLIRQQAAAMLPIYQANAVREDANRNRVEDREDRQRFQEQQMRLSRELAAANRAPEGLVVVNTPNGPQYVRRSAAVGQAPYGTNEPLESVIGPNGQPELVRRSQAVGRQPYRAADAEGRPLSATELNLREESESAMQGAQSARSTLQRALELSPEAYAGFGAEMRGGVAGQTGYDSRSAEATRQFSALMTQQALGQLRNIFGGNPTEGERNILMRMQATPGMSRVEREALLRQAIGMVEQREARARTRLEQVVRGTYGRAEPNYTPPAPAAVPPAARPPLSSFGG